MQTLNITGRDTGISRVQSFHLDQEILPTWRIGPLSAETFDFYFGYLELTASWLKGERDPVLERCLSVVVPVYNEERTLEEVVGKVLKLPQLLELILVDDCSQDRTPEILHDLAVRYPDVIVTIRHAKNCGKTAALKTGFRLTRGDIVMVQDADLEYDPAEIPDVIAPIIANQADVVFGSRFLVRKAARAIYFYHYLANKGLTFLSDMATNINLTDVETCYKAFRGDIIRKMKISSSGFGFEIEVIAKVAKLKCAIYETPISYYGRTYEEGKKITAMDGIAAFYYVIRYNLFCSLAQSFESPPQLRTKDIQCRQ